MQFFFNWVLSHIVREEKYKSVIVKLFFFYWWIRVFWFLILIADSFKKWIEMTFLELWSPISQNPSVARKWIIPWKSAIKNSKFSLENLCRAVNLSIKKIVSFKISLQFKCAYFTWGKNLFRMPRFTYMVCKYFIYLKQSFKGSDFSLL